MGTFSDFTGDAEYIRQQTEMLYSIGQLVNGERESLNRRFQEWKREDEQRIRREEEQRREQARLAYEAEDRKRREQEAENERIHFQEEA